MAEKIKYGATQKEIERGYKDGMHDPKDENTLDEDPLNSLWRDWDDGGFLGRPKGGE
jgi:hypothetical protein